MKQTRFPGFPAAALTFLRSLARNNQREWFQPRKEDFERHVKAPMAELVHVLNGELARFAPEYITEPQKAIFRIYRDTRFSADKTPYKTQIAVSFKRRGLDRNVGAGLYFSVSPKQIEVAGGVYMPGPEQLLAIRNHLATHHEEFRRLLAERKLHRLMGELWGEPMKRVPKGFAAGHPAADLLRCRHWVLYVLLDAKLATSPRLLPELVSRFQAVKPVAEFLNGPLLALRRQEARRAMV